MKEKFVPAKLVVDTLIDGKDLDMVSVNTFTYLGNVKEVDDSEFLIQFNELLTSIKSKGVVFNSSNDDRDVLAKKIANKFGPLTDVYLPFEVFNKASLIDEDGEVITPTVGSPTPKAYSLAAFYKYKYPKDEGGSIRFNTMDENVKKFSGRDIHTLLGSKCVTKVKFLMIYTTDDCETAAEIDFKTTGTASFGIKVASELNIPIFNLHKKGRITDLVDYISNL